MSDEVASYFGGRSKRGKVEYFQFFVVPNVQEEQQEMCMSLISN